MTGYGKGEMTLNSMTVTVELKSVNHRFLDLSIKAPSAFNFAEDYIRKAIQADFARGHIDCYISVSVNGLSNNKEYTYNLEQIDAYLKMAKEINTQFGIENNLTMADILRLPQSLVEKRLDDNADELLELLKGALSVASSKLIEMRQKEGDNLKEALIKHLNRISDSAESIAISAPMVVESYREKLKNRITEYLGEVNPDESRLLTEVAVFSDKVNIDEEINRLFSHISQFNSIICSEQPVGKTLDFLVQEMNREANTIGSKANNVNITKVVVELKNEIEKLREQIQNIE